METQSIYISHNKAGHSNPSAISKYANEVVFDMNKVSKSLQAKVYGQIGIIELTRDEMQEIRDAATIVRRVGHNMMVKLGLTNN